MPRTKRPKPIYARGTFQLIRRPDRANLQIIWYCAASGRERSASAGTSDDQEGELALDRHYLRAMGKRICGECGRPMESDGSPLLSQAISDYLLTKQDTEGFAATRGRLAHVVEYLASGEGSATCAQIDTMWVNRFRKWLSARPVNIGKTGKTRDRSLSHVEGCILQLAAAINATPGQEAAFGWAQPKDVANSPKYRADLPMLARMFRFCLEPEAKSERERALRIKERTNLLRYLRAAVATWARPEEIFDIGKKQWIAAAQVLDLNPPGRRQTRKHRTKVPIPRPFAPHLDMMEERYMPVESIRASWDKMRNGLDLPSERGEAYVKLIRRSVSQLVRDRIGEERWRQGEMMLGHVHLTTSDIYAIRKPEHVGLALATTEAIINEIEVLCPGAYGLRP